MPGRWTHALFFSTDQKSYTGYTSKMGADYLVMGGRLYRYSGSGPDWSWQDLGFASYSFTGNEMEIRLDKSDIELLALEVESMSFYTAIMRSA